VNEAVPDIAETRFILPPDVKLLPVAELSARLRARIGPVAESQSVVTRQGFRVTTRLVPQPLALLISEFRSPSRLTDAIFRFARSNGQDPQAVLDLAFDALATLVEARLLVPQGAPEATAPGPSLASGQDFAGFEIEILIRSLEDSEVFRARAPDGRTVALKLARDERPGVADLLAREARTLEALRGGDSPELLSHGREGGRAYVTMEWCDGVSIGVAAQQLRAARDRGRLHDLVGRMLAAYGRLHERGVLHGDIHPGNCLARADGRIVILDFGHARRIGEARSTADLARAGIPQFYDPQMAQAILAVTAPPAASPASEQYAIAVLAYMLLTGLHPIDAPSVQDELLRRIVERSPLPFAARGVPSWPGVEAVIARALSRKPADRYPAVSSLARAFASTDLPPNLLTRRRDIADRAFDVALKAVRSLAPGPRWRRDTAWLALRAALALEDVELLAAADRLTARADVGCAGSTVAARLAQAQSDSRAEARAIDAFLAAARRLSDGPQFAWAMLASAQILEGSASRTTEVQSLAAWAAQGFRRLVPASRGRKLHATPADPFAAYVALSLVRAGRAPASAALAGQLKNLAVTRSGDVWLWTLAHDVFADERYRTLALSLSLPQRPLARGFALLRLYQLTGDRRWLVDARDAAAKASEATTPGWAVALLLAELRMPEAAMLPPFRTVFGVPVPVAAAPRSAGATPMAGRPSTQ
jgi:hypothetical protein